MQSMTTRNGAGGSYLLVLVVPPCTPVVGSLGAVPLPGGVYVYAGSALGPGGIAARVGRHRRTEKAHRWHIDYLTAVASVIMTVAVLGDHRLECSWARSLLALPGASVPVPGFGASDCRAGCRAHLVRLPDGFDLTNLETYLCQIPT
jgi:Uri superfamily endonuclease